MSMGTICTRDEVLTDRIVNTNLGYISQKPEDGRGVEPPLNEE